MDIAQLKAQLSILTVLEHYQLQPNRNGLLCCPFHEDKTPSLQIYPKTNTYCCFSSNCTAGTGDAIQFIELMDKQGKHQAIRKAESLLGNPVKASQPTTGEALSRLAVLAKFYEGSCHRNETAVAYLQSRGLTGIQAGYVSEKMGLNWNEQLKQNALTLGLLLQKPDGYLTPRFKGCAVFPLKNRQGQIVSIYGRSVTDQDSQRHYYLPGQRQGLYPGYPAPATTKLILTESVIDAATLLQVSVINEQYAVLALYGTNGLTEEHRTALRELAHLQEVILFLDGDEPGREALSMISKQLSVIRPELTISAVDTPEGEDINSLPQSHEPTVLLHLIDNRLPIPATTSQAPPMPEPVPLPAPSTPQALNSTNPELLTFTQGALLITVLGGVKLTGLDRLRVTLKLDNRKQHRPALRHSLDLYHAEQLDKLIDKTAEQLGLSSREVEPVIHALIDALESYRTTRLESMRYKPPTRPALTQGQMEAATRYLKSPKLMERTLEDLGKTGIVGEERNRVLMYLVFLSRLTADPLHIISLGASGTGKTYLQEKVSALVPSEAKLEITTLSENALYYFGQDELKHKLLLIEDLDGAQEVLYPLRELQSKQKISKTVSLKDNKGNIKTVTFTVNGPVCISGCTTRERLYDDNENRSLIIHLDASAQQDQAIMDYQRRKAAGAIDHRQQADTIALLQNVQRILQPVRIVNPYAHRLILPEAVLKKRRSNQLYLKFIETITLYHQHQRKRKADLFSEGDYIETTLADIAWANRLLKEVLLSKSDELSGACRRFLETLKAHLEGQGQSSFYAKEVRQALRLNASNLKRYLIELTRNGYLTIRTGSKAKGYRYEVVSYQEYTQLRNGVDTVLDDLLAQLQEEERIKLNGKAVSSSVVQ